MKLGGMTPVSVSDWPGMVSTVVFTQGCNFRCPFCHNPGLIPLDSPDSLGLSEERFIRFLDGKRGKTDGVVISGGEPSIQPDLPRFIREIRAMGFKVKLDTNGSRPDVIRRLLAEGLLDFAAMDVKAPPGRLDELAGVSGFEAAVAKTMSILAGSGIPHRFRTTFYKKLLTEDDMLAIESSIPAGSPHVRQAYKDLGRKRSKG